MRAEDDAAPAEATETRHDLRRHVVGTQAVDDDDELGV